MTDWLTVHIGDNRDILPTLPAESVHCVVTSPPYWGLRDYGTASWEGGDEGCDHMAREVRAVGERKASTLVGTTETIRAAEMSQALYRDTCGKCGARRIDRQLGLEATPEEYVANLVAVFREVRRVLRSDGTVWLNLGDSYAGSGKGAFGTEEARDAYRPKVKEVYVPTRAESPTAGLVPPGLKPKDLVGIPWRVAFALQADGWYLRSDIIWSKPNPMPESVTDRPTKSHEYVFLLAKSARYYFDQEAVRSPVKDGGGKVRNGPIYSAPASAYGIERKTGNMADDAVWVTPTMANIRSVWTINTQPYPGAHFAVFPEALVEPCIKAGTSAKGVCAECGAPWERVVETARILRTNGGASPAHSDLKSYSESSLMRTNALPVTTTTGWRPTCAHDAATVPATVLDPFAGSGTTGRVANRLSRRAILIELNDDYHEQIAERNLQAPLGLAG